MICEPASHYYQVMTRSHRHARPDRGADLRHRGRNSCVLSPDRVRITKKETSVSVSCGPISGAKSWSNGYMPASFQGTVLRAGDVPIHDLAVPEGADRATRRLPLDRLREKNEAYRALRSDNSELRRADRGPRASLCLGWARSPRGRPTLGFG